MTPFVGAAIRHIFAHGHLSASPKEANSEDIVAICTEMLDFLLSYMDEEFSKFVEHQD